MFQHNNNAPDFSGALLLINHLYCKWTCCISDDYQESYLSH
jgi:hypothetical protein